MAEAPWLLNIFVKSSAPDVCARLGLPFSQFQDVLLGCGASLMTARTTMSMARGRRHQL
jgi:hypothetical protein